jgi:hypothetical protein
MGEEKAAWAPSESCNIPVPVRPGIAERGRGGAGGSAWNAKPFGRFVVSSSLRGQITGEADAKELNSPPLHYLHTVKPTNGRLPVLWRFEALKHKRPWLLSISSHFAIGV